MTARAPILLLAALLAGGCLPDRVSGHFGAEAYYHHRDQYRVRYDGADARLLGEPWELANFERDASGRPTHHVVDDALVSRYDAARYARLRGRPVLELARQDLRFESTDSGSTIFVRTVPLRAPWTADPLPVLMRRSVASMASYQSDGPDLLGRGPATGGARVRLLREGPARVDGQPAYFVEFDLDSVDASGARADRVTLVGLVPPRPLALRGRAAVQTLLVFGLVGAPGAHEDERPALASLVRRIDLAPREGPPR